MSLVGNYGNNRRAAANTVMKKGMIPLYEDEDQDYGVIEGTDADGNQVLLQVLDYFFYNGEEYAILTDADEDDCECGCASCEHECDHECDHEEACSCESEEDEDPEEITCYIMKVVTSTEEDGEEVEDFVPVEDEALEAKLIEIATTKLNADDDDDDEDDDDNE